MPAFPGPSSPWAHASRERPEPAASQTLAGIQAGLIVLPQGSQMKEQETAARNPERIYVKTAERCRDVAVGKSTGTQLSYEFICWIEFTDSLPEIEPEPRV